MSNNESLGPVQVFDNDVFSINAALQELSGRIDEAKGLRGRTTIFDRAGVSTPVEQSDAVTLGATEGRFMTLEDDQTITGTKTFTLPLRMVDADGHLVHAFGAIT